MKFRTMNILPFNNYFSWEWLYFQPSKILNSYLSFILLTQLNSTRQSIRQKTLHSLHFIAYTPYAINARTLASLLQKYHFSDIFMK